MIIRPHNCALPLSTGENARRTTQKRWNAVVKCAQLDLDLRNVYTAPGSSSACVRACMFTVFIHLSRNAMRWRSEWSALVCLCINRKQHFQLHVYERVPCTFNTDYAVNCWLPSSDLNMLFFAAHNICCASCTRVQRGRDDEISVCERACVYLGQCSRIYFSDGGFGRGACAKVRLHCLVGNRTVLVYGYSVSHTCI